MASNGYYLKQSSRKAEKKAAWLAARSKADKIYWEKVALTNPYLKEAILRAEEKREVKKQAAILKEVERKKALEQKLQKKKQDPGDQQEALDKERKLRAGITISSGRVEIGNIQICTGLPMIHMVRYPRQYLHRQAKVPYYDKRKALLEQRLMRWRKRNKYPV